MRSMRYLATGVAVRTFARWTVRRKHPAWSPVRWGLLLVLRVVPGRVLGFLGLHGVLHQRRRLVTDAPGPARALALVVVWAAIAVIRDELPEPVRRKLLG